MSDFRLTDFDAVAFDFEGTLADTIPTHHSTRMAAFAERGFGHISKRQHELGPTYGSSHSDILGGILHAAGEIDKSVPFGQNQKVLDVIARKAKLFKAAAAHGFNEMPEATDFLKLIATYFIGNMAIVTSSEEEFIFPFVERYDLASYFAPDLVIGHESVISEGLNVKPSGDPYLLAMKRLHANKLLVFEDTVPGVAAGKKAGATVIALAFDAQSSLIFNRGGLEYSPDAIVGSYEEAARMLAIQK